MKLVLDLHEIYNRSDEIERALNDVIAEIGPASRANEFHRYPR